MHQGSRGCIITNRNERHCEQGLQGEGRSTAYSQSKSGRVDRLAVSPRCALHWRVSKQQAYRESGRD